MHASTTDSFLHRNRHPSAVNWTEQAFVLRIYYLQIETRQIKGNVHLFFIVDLSPWAEHWSWSKSHTLMWRCISRADETLRELLCMQNRFSAKAHGCALRASDSLCRIYGGRSADTRRDVPLRQSNRILTPGFFFFLVICNSWRYNFSFSDAFGCWFCRILWRYSDLSASCSNGDHHQTTLDSTRASKANRTTTFESHSGS